jgi:acyl-ACP thioesterase
MLKYLANPRHYRITKVYYNNIVTNFVKISKYVQYKYKKEGKLYPCNLLKIDIFKSSYITTFNKRLTIIDFSDFNNNCKYVQRIFQTIESILK